MSAAVPVLTFHSIDGSGSPVSTSPEAFERLIAYLGRRGYKGLSLQAAVSCLREGKLPEDGLVITFDDGYLNNLTHAAPVLARHGFTATVFVATGYCGKTNAWPDQNSSIPELPMMTWDQLREIRSWGIDLGAHTHTHPRLTRVEIPEAEAEMLRSKREIEDHIGEPVTLFAYPYGDMNSAVRVCVSRHFDGAMGTRPGRLRPGIDLHALERINACGRMFGLLPLRVREAGRFGVYLSLKRALDRIQGRA